MTATDPVDLDRSKWTSKPPRASSATPIGAGPSDVVLLREKERRLATIEEELEDDTAQLDAANDAAAQAKYAWEVRLARITLNLAADGVKTSEQQRRSLAMEGAAGERAFYEMVATDSVASTLRSAMKAKADRIGALQTLIRGLRTATGIDP